MSNRKRMPVSPLVLIPTLELDENGSPLTPQYPEIANATIRKMTAASCASWSICLDLAGKGSDHVHKYGATQGIAHC